MLKVEKLYRGETFVNFANFDTFLESFSSRNPRKCIILDNAPYLSKTSNISFYWNNLDISKLNLAIS